MRRQDVHHRTTLGTGGGWWKEGDEDTCRGLCGPTDAMCVFVFHSDIVNCDLKSTLRVLYNLFTKYRNVE